jgi:hypothetical protein
METFRATLRRPEVQAKYRADYEQCENNPKRGAVLKIFEVAGVDTRAVKVSLWGGGAEGSGWLGRMGFGVWTGRWRVVGNHVD